MYFFRGVVAHAALGVLPKQDPGCFFISRGESLLIPMRDSWCQWSPSPPCPECCMFTRYGCPPPPPPLNVGAVGEWNSHVNEALRVKSR